MHALSRRTFLLGAGGVFMAGTSSTLAQSGTDARPAVMAPLGEDAVTRLGSAQEALLSGRVFVVATGKNDEPASGQDVVRFSGSLLSTDLCDRFGFKPAPYHLSAEGPTLHVMAALVSAEQGELRLAGRIVGDRLVAEANWRRPRWYGDIHVRIWFDGVLADPSAEHAAWLD
ncbi:MAG: hypothetical protein KJO42_07140 [Silicimonas sp.]|nr:hypothetical protein [Silicimonas sp.]